MDKPGAPSASIPRVAGLGAGEGCVAAIDCAFYPGDLWDIDGTFMGQRWDIFGTIVGVFGTLLGDSGLMREWIPPRRSGWRG